MGLQPCAAVVAAVAVAVDQATQNDYLVISFQIIIETLSVAISREKAQMMHQDCVQTDGENKVLYFVMCFHIYGCYMQLL